METKDIEQLIRKNNLLVKYLEDNNYPDVEFLKDEKGRYYFKIDIDPKRLKSVAKGGKNRTR